MRRSWNIPIGRIQKTAPVGGTRSASAKVWKRVSRYMFFFQAEDGIRDHCVTGVQTCALPIFNSGQSLQWTRVHDLPDFVYFNHSIHVAKGVGCYSCHGQVDEMPLMYAENTLQMEWCLNCHRQPEKFLRPKEEVFNMKYQQPSSERPVEVVMDGQKKSFTSQLELGTFLRDKYHLRTTQDITSCSTCHR